ncbi:hypothetical protein VNO77_43394 [Canavalia gladiata]|uniref:Uncharacterized protein n=1 Tax=Canavalia gladiata TaxID=3824 RepID=A0AAN9JWD6_CANGL
MQSEVRFFFWVFGTRDNSPQNASRVLSYFSLFLLIIGPQIVLIGFSAWLPPASLSRCPILIFGVSVPHLCLNLRFKLHTKCHKLHGPTMAGITLLLDLWRKNQSFYTAPTYQSSFFSASATVASFAAATSFASKDFFGFRPPVAYCDAGAAISEDYTSNIRSVPQRYFYHDSLKYSTKHNIELKPIFSAFELKSFAMITLRSFLMFYLPLLEPHAKMEQVHDDFLQHKRNDPRGNLTDPFKKSMLQIVREVTVVTTRRILERIAVHHVPRRTAWKLIKDVPQSAVRKAGRKMPISIYFCSVSKATFRGYLLGVSASWLVQVGIGLFQCFNSKLKNGNDNVEKAKRKRLIRQMIVMATVRCNASLIFASIGAGIGALIRPSVGQCVGCAVGDLVGPVIVAVGANKFFHLNL